MNLDGRAQKDPRSQSDKKIGNQTISQKETSQSREKLPSSHGKSLGIWHPRKGESSSLLGRRQFPEQDMPSHHMPSYAITCHNVTSHDITAISFPIKHISLEMVKQKASCCFKESCPYLPRTYALPLIWFLRILSFWMNLEFRTYCGHMAVSCTTHHDIVCLGVQKVWVCVSNMCEIPYPYLSILSQPSLQASPRTHCSTKLLTSASSSIWLECHPKRSLPGTFNVQGTPMVIKFPSAFPCCSSLKKNMEVPPSTLRQCHWPVSPKQIACERVRTLQITTGCSHRSGWTINLLVLHVWQPCTTIRLGNGCKGPLHIIF